MRARGSTEQATQCKTANDFHFHFDEQTKQTFILVKFFRIFQDVIVWPSGLRRGIKAPISSEAQVRTLQRSDFFFVLVTVIIFGSSLGCHL